MMPFARNNPPSAWIKWEADWRSECELGSFDPKADHWSRIVKLQSDKQRLPAWFHRTVRSDVAAPALCAYCDVTLGPASPDTIDHFMPRAMCAEKGRYDLILSWSNLFPACFTCNTKAKQGRWSSLLLRPDVDPVRDYFELRPDTGYVIPNRSLASLERARADETINTFGLNEFMRPEMRADLVKDMSDNYALAMEAASALAKTTNAEFLRRKRTKGPYRFVVEWFATARGVDLDPGEGGVEARREERA